MNLFRYIRAALLTSVLIGAGDRAVAQDSFVYGTTPETPEVRRMVASSEAQGWAQIGQTFLQRARETGDPTHYAKAEVSFQKALDLDPQNVEAMGGMGSLCLSRHRFAEALAWGERARALNPYNATLYGIIGDACVELGDYAKAAEAVQRMVDLRPGLSAYSRISYLRELRGDPEGAIQAMGMAVRAGGPNAENTSWCLVQLGNLYFGRGDLGSAEIQYRGALARLPNYAHALAGLGRVRAAQRNYEEAISLYSRVVAAMPLSEYVIALGDVYQHIGRIEEAVRQYELVRAMERLYRANGVDTDLEMALFDADHDRNISDALERARQEVKRRPSIHASDVLAWTLYRAGKYREALLSARQALRLGTKDALMFFHAGMISYRLGERKQARDDLERTLSLNPYFSVRYAPEAERVLKELRAEKSLTTREHRERREK